MSIEIYLLIITLLSVALFATIISIIRQKKRQGLESLIYDIYNNIECGILILDNKNRIIKINHRITAIFGLSYYDLDKKPISELLESNRNVNFFEKFETALKRENLNNGIVHSFQELIVTKFDMKVNLECRIVPHLKSDKLKNTVIVIRDISELIELRKKTDILSEKISLNEEKHPLVNFIASVSRNMDISLMKIGNKIISLIGISADAAIDNPSFLLPVDKRERELFKHTLQTSCQNLVPIDFIGKYKHTDGSEKYLNIHALPYHEDNQLYLKGFINDITESHTQNQIIKEQRQFLFSVIENSPIGIFAKDYPKGKYLVVNGKAIEYFEKPQADLLNSVDKEIFEESDLFFNHLADIESECITSMQTVTGQTFEYTTDLGIKQIYLQCFPVIVDGNLKQTIGIIHDLTENVNIINTYKERQNKLTAIVENNMVGVVVVDRNYSIQFANKAISKMTGYSINELNRMTISDISNPNYKSSDTTSLQKL